MTEMTTEEVNRLLSLGRRAGRLIETRDKLQHMLEVIEHSDKIDIQTPNASRIEISSELMPTAYPAIRQGMARMAEIIAEACDRELAKLQDELRKAGAA